MGVLTHSQLVTESLEMAGNTGLTTRAQTWLGLLLRQLFGSFDYPVEVGNGTFPVLALTAGVGQYALPVSGNNVVRGVSRVLVTPSGQRDWQPLGLYTGDNVPGNAIPDDVSASFKATLTARQGRPRQVLLVPDTDKVDLLFSPIPDGNYYALIVGSGLTTDLLTYSAGNVNPYPDDLTVMQGLTAMALKHMNDERAAAEWRLFEKMTMQDRVRYGMMNGANSTVGLSPRRFRGAGNTGGNNAPPGSTGWMGPV